MTTTIPKSEHREYMHGGAYDVHLSSKPPLMYIEIFQPAKHKLLGDLVIVAFGAYNAMGLIGPEMGGVAITLELPNKAILATKAVPYNPAARKALLDEIVAMIKKGNYVGDAHRARASFMADLRIRGFETRDGL